MKLFFCPNIAKNAEAYALLAYAIRQVHDLYNLPVIARTEHGKPFFPNHPQLHFNLSHSGPLALCALDDSPVGVDIESFRPHHPRLAQRICSPTELEWFNAQSDPRLALLSLWTKKEARVKQMGCGLTVPLREVCVPLGSNAVLDGLHFHSLSGESWVAATCGHSSPVELCTVPAEMLKNLDTIPFK